MSGPMLDIGDWLEKLGLSEHAQCFSEHMIDVSVLRHLTDQDLENIGIPLGHRRKILAAISSAPAPRDTMMRATADIPTPPMPMK